MEPELYENKKNTLSINLAESAVFLNADVHRARRDRGVEQKPTMLRGLLILYLAKPTKITSIEVDLSATSSVSWLEGEYDSSNILPFFASLSLSLGIGSRRIEVNENHQVFHASAFYFEASKSNNSRRTASIGPGIYYNRSHDPYYNDDLNDWHDSLRAAPIHITASPATSGGPSRSNNIIESTQRNADLFPRISHSTPPSRPLLDQSRNRRGSVDSTQIQPMFLDELDEGTTDLDMQHLAPIPPYSPFAQPVSSESSRFPTMHGGNDVGASTHSLTSPAPSSEDFRHSLHRSLRSSYRSQSKNELLSKNKNRLTSLYLGRTTSSRSQSVIPEDDILELEFNTNPSADPSTPRLMSTTPSSPPPTSTYGYHPLDNQSSPSPLQQPPRGRKLFSLSAVSNVIIDAVRSSSPRTNQLGHSREREYERYRERSVDTTSRGRRGRTMERVSEIVNSDSVGDRLQKDSSQAKGRGVIAMLMGDRDKEVGKEGAEGWKEFKKGLQ